ncbi:MAG: hypothetical protein LBC63_01855 [Holophagales bacterium]|nr:hypothetical protein [Holophagales bacterium]
MKHTASLPLDFDRLWAPLPGPQEMAYNSLADELFYGGAAGGGKTDLLLGLALREHRRGIIFRRVYPSLSAIVERSKEIYGGAGSASQEDPDAEGQGGYLKSIGAYNETKRCWKFVDGRIVQFGAMQFEKNKSAYQGRPHDFYGFDEITEFTESMYRFAIGWNRSAKKGQRCRVVCAGNPPTGIEGDWVLSYWAPWLDPAHPKPALPGELRWFTTIGGKDVELGDGEPIEVDGEMITPRSRTFVPARVQDNPFLMESGYLARLQAMPEPLRSKLLYGDFSSGREDAPYQVIPTEWVRAAQERWKNAPRPDLPMAAMGVDVARGGGDMTVLAMRHGNWVDELRCFPGASTPDGQAVAAMVLANMRGGATINVDVVGVGASVYDQLKRVAKSVVPINGASASAATDKSGQIRFINLRAELWWKLREALDPANGADICLPPDRALLADLCAPAWQLTFRGVQIESKEDIKARLGRSPDRGDAVAYAFAKPRRPGMGLSEWLEGENMGRGQGRTSLAPET